MTIPLLRDYQQDSINENYRIFTDLGFVAPINHLATGLGKSAIVTSFTRQHIDLDVKRALVIVDKITLVNQMWGNYKRFFPESQNKYTIHNRPGLGRVMNTYNDVAARVVVATPQTLAGAPDDDSLDPDLSRLEDILEFGPIDLVVYDEAHSAICNRTVALHNRLLESNPDMWTIGPTATPRRHDGVSMRVIFDSVGPSYSLKWGIANGYLCPIGQTLQFYAEMDGLSHKKMKMGKFSNAFELMESAYMEHARDRKTAWYMNSVQESRDFCMYMQESGHRIAHIDSEYCIDFNGHIATDKYARERILKAFEKGPDLMHITNYEVLSTGWDCPPVACIAVQRSTENITWLTQVIGRGTRVHDSKDDLMILDFGTKQLELFMEDNNLLDGFGLKGKSAPVEDEEEKGEKNVDDPDQLEDDEIITGKGIIVKEIDLLQGFGGSWYKDDFMQYSLQLNDQLVLVVTSPDKIRAEKIKEMMEAQPEYAEELRPLWEYRMSYALWVVNLEKQKSRNGREYTTATVNDAPEFQNEYLDLVLDAARPWKVQYGDPKLFQPGRRWRKKPASDGQIRFLRTLGYDGVIKDMDHASRLITHYKCVPVVADKIRDMMLLATELYRETREEVVA